MSGWNTLSEVVVEIDAIVSLKRLLDRHMNMQVMEEYGLCAGRYEIMIGTDIMGQRTCSCGVLFYAL